MDAQQQRAGPPYHRYLRAMHVAVVGAGVGGLTAAALLLKAGCKVTVLEAHVYPGGCAGTFFHKGYRFDAGATLAGGFSDGGPHARVGQLLGLTWPIQAVDPAWVVHLPGLEVAQPASAAAWEETWRRAFPESGAFWKRQEELAKVSWDISARDFPWPPQTVSEALRVLTAINVPVLRTVPHLFHTVEDLLGDAGPQLKTFVDAQLLIAAQTTAAHCGALYGCAALDLPRRGVNHVHGGMGGLAQTLWDWLHAHGATLHKKQQVTQLDAPKGRPAQLTTHKGLVVEADVVLANLTPWALSSLLGDQAPPAWANRVKNTPATWGAFTVYAGVDAARLPTLQASHHQVVVDPSKPLGEGNSVFISFPSTSDTGRAPPGRVAVTLSTHTQVEPWWRLKQEDAGAYRARQQELTHTLLHAANQAIPGFQAAVELALPGTPLAFERFTRRPQGMVGGFAQTSLFDVQGPGVGLANVFLVGDSIFPGQSTAGVTLGAMRVAQRVLDSFPTHSWSLASASA